MESTVIKPNCEAKTVEILRMGALSKTEIQECLCKNEKFRDYIVLIKGKKSLTSNENTDKNLVKETNNNDIYNSKDNNGKNNNNFGDTNEKSDFSKLNNIHGDDILESQIAPGQFLKHYSPIIDAYILDNQNIKDDHYEISIKNLKNTILLDFNKQMYNVYGNVFGNIKDLSEKGSDLEVIKNLYDYLHWTESCDGMEKLLICDLSRYPKPINKL